MQVIESPKVISALSISHLATGKSIGLVPTMGALHQGHLSLVRQSVKDNDVTMVSIFVNPLQFNNASDLANYPRSLDADLSILEGVGVDLIFAPSEAVMYPDQPVITIDFGMMGRVMEGAFRPGHFSGVGTVVSKLFHFCQPTRSYFGLKDLQQFLLIRRLVMDLSFPIEVIGMPIVREPSGLAMSSRNQGLSSQGAKTATALYQGLLRAEAIWRKGASPEETKVEVLDFYGKINGLEMEYFHTVSPDTLQELTNNTKENVAFCVAGYVEGIRLIDNLYLRQD